MLDLHHHSNSQLTKKKNSKLRVILFLVAVINSIDGNQITLVRKTLRWRRPAAEQTQCVQQLVL